jgi:hypothetical protein
MAAFVTRLQPRWLPIQAARQLPEQSTTLRVAPTATGDTRIQGALHLCLLFARGTDEQLNRMAGVSRPAKAFTPKQGQYLAFIHLYTRLHRRPPAETDMQEYFRVSPPSVHQMVLTLERAGFIRRQPRVARSIEMLIDPKSLPELL